MNPLRPGLTQPIPPGILALPVDERGYPIPWFVPFVDGKPEFRASSRERWKEAVLSKRCWVCGDYLSSTYAFIGGPMCAVNRTSAEPPSHYNCAIWSVKNCPFMVKPQMIRRPNDREWDDPKNVAGTMLDRNPGVAFVWRTHDYRLFPDGKGMYLIEIGLPIEKVEWFREGQPATKSEVEESISSGLVNLAAMCRNKDEQRELNEHAKKVERYLPVETQR